MTQVTVTQKAKIGIWNLEFGIKNQEARSKKQEARSWNLEYGIWNLEFRNLLPLRGRSKSSLSNIKSKVKIQKSKLQFKSQK